MQIPKCVLFDLGGVLVELGPIRDLWFKKYDLLPDHVLWEKWLNSSAVQMMDTGRISTHEFCVLWKKEQSLNVSVKNIQSTYEKLAIGPFDGSLELVARIKEFSAVGALSNMNSCHWPIVLSFGFDNMFDFVFTSHTIGAAKPDKKIFDYAVEHCPFDPEDILFIDDNQLNVDSARRLRFVSEKACGLEETKEVLSRYFDGQL